MSVPDFREKINSELREGRVLLEEKNYNRAIACANQCGSVVFKAMTNEEGISQELLFTDLKQVVFLLIEGFRRSQCGKCFVSSLNQLFHFLLEIRSNTLFPTHIRQNCGDFINGLLELPEVSVVRQYLSQEMQSNKKYHLVLAS